MINRIVVWGIGIFFALGAADYLLGGKMGLGKTFEKTLHKMGLILMGVMGVYSLAPVLAQFVTPVVTPLAGALGLDPSVFPAMLFPIDMGGYQLAMDAAKDADMGLASAVLTSSICGATVGYTITVAVTVVDKKHHGALAKGILSGMVGVPVGCLAGALMCGVNPMTALYNTLPLCVLAALLIGGFWGGMSGAVGLTIADLTSGYVTSAPKTFLLKLCIGLVSGFVAHKVFHINNDDTRKAPLPCRS